MSQTTCQVLVQVVMFQIPSGCPWEKPLAQLALVFCSWLLHPAAACSEPIPTSLPRSLPRGPGARPTAARASKHMAPTPQVHDETPTNAKKNNPPVVLRGKRGQRKSELKGGGLLRMQGMSYHTSAPASHENTCFTSHASVSMNFNWGTATL